MRPRSRTATDIATDDGRSKPRERGGGVHRRTLLSGGLATLVWAALRGEVLAAEAPAKRCIVLWMNGGPSHIDTFDPKTGVTAGPFRSIATRAPGVRIGEHLPRLAESADRLCIVRGMSSREGNHDRARYLGHTGYAPNATVAHPSLGGWVSRELGATSDLPAFVSVGGPSAGAGFFGPEHGPFIVPEAGAPRRTWPQPSTTHD